MSTPTATAFDLAALKRAIEDRDAAGQVALYAPDAEVRLVDRITTPRSPRVLRGRDEIAGWIEDVCGREMTHRVEQEVVATAASRSPRPAATRTERTCCA
jgi:hypothetical protein